MVLNFGTGLFGEVGAEIYIKDQAKGTFIYSINATAFTSTKPDVDDVLQTGAQIVNNDPSATVFLAPISLPDNATITRAALFGNAQAVSLPWGIYRAELRSTTGAGICSAQVNAIGIAHGNTVVDNYLYSYYLTIQVPDTTPDAALYGAWIEYTI